MRRHINWISGAALALSIPSAYAGAATRVSGFEYDATTGLLTKEIIQPIEVGSDPNLCLETEYQYDTYGNKTKAITRSCAGATSEAPIETRESNTEFASGSVLIGSTTYNWSAGQFPTTSKNALWTESLNHKETKKFDPRFGMVVELTGPNNLTTTWEYDGFGRKTRERRVDTTQTTWDYVRCTSSCSLTLKTVTVSYSYYVQETPRDQAGNAIGAYTRTYMDTLNRAIRTETEGFDGTLVFKDTEYDSLGRVAHVSQQYYSGAQGQAGWTSYQHDSLGRVTQMTDPEGAVTTTAYNGLTATVTVDPDGAGLRLAQTRKTVKNSQGEVVSVRTNEGSTDATVDATITFTYDAFGNLKTTTDPLGNVTTLSYDLRGRKTEMLDPDMGRWTYRYNALGELKWQCDPKGRGQSADCSDPNATRMTYDKLGRMLTRVERDLTTTWVYDTETTGIGKLASVSAASHYTRTHTYDPKGRPASTTVTIGTETFTSNSSYDAPTGRLDVLTYPEHSTGNGFAVKHSYNVRGYMTEVRKNADQSLIWRADTLKASGKVLTETLGNALTTTRDYDKVDRLKSAVVSSNVQDDTYHYDLIGNLVRRTWKYPLEGVPTQVTESFTYDDLNRLRTSGGETLLTREFTYDKIGNVITKSDVGTLSYPASGASSMRPHAVSSVSASGVNGGITATYNYDDNGNLARVTNGTIWNLTNSSSVSFSRTLQYMSFNLPSVIQQTQGGNSYTYTYTYGADHERVKLITERPDETVTSVYVHPDNKGGLMYERDVGNGASGTVHRYYVAGIGFYKVSGGTEGMNYYHRDHLGSIVAVTNASGGIVQSYSYETFGERRQVTGGRQDRTSPLFGLATSAATDRGYTGHEHLDELNLVHMNGRIYDPALARFMTPDPMIDGTYDLQSFNRYSYVNNNPLAYTDPSGYFKIGPIKFKVSKDVRTIAGIALAAYIGFGDFSWLWGQSALGVQGLFGPGLQTAFTAGFWGSMVASGGDHGAALRGGLAAAAFSFVGGLSLPLEGAILAHGIVGGISSELDGGTFASGFLSSAFAKGAGSELYSDDLIADTVTHAVIGGTASAIGGGKFENGAMTASFAYLFNSASSVRRGDLGQAMMVSAVHGQGGTVIGQKLLWEAVDARGRPQYWPDGRPIRGEADALTRTRYKEIVYEEAKFGRYSDQSTNQRATLGYVFKGLIRFYGSAAEAAGLAGQTLKGYMSDNKYSWGGYRMWGFGGSGAPRRLMTRMNRLYGARGD